MERGVYCIPSKLSHPARRPDARLQSKNKTKSVVSTECKIVYNLSYAAVGSQFNCISRDGEFDSRLIRFNTFPEIHHGIISIGPRLG